jgi:hypothetical protein
MNHVVEMMLSGLSEKDIRSDLNDFLAHQKQSGGMGNRGKKTYTMAISILGSWFSPPSDLVGFRDHALHCIRNEKKENWVSYHWAVICASYPLWFNVAKQTGRLFNLQDAVSQSQIKSRLREQYGARETVSRNVRYTIRSFNAWNVIEDLPKRGWYKQSTNKLNCSPSAAAVLFESAMLASNVSALTMSTLQFHPSFFPFSISSIPFEAILNSSEMLSISNIFSGDYALSLKSSF